MDHKKLPEFLLGELHSDMKTVLRDLKEIKGTQKTFDRRLGSLEMTRSKGLGFIAAFCLVWAFVSEYVKQKFGMSI